ncbi:hypothetical protein, partial [Variovorax sp. JS1663]|uniref:hypothetical protein n=1 Tax=Variovorax sp. JS1663 TaxID=1851577 RepID=UPI00117D7EBE
MKYLCISLLVFVFSNQAGAASPNDLELKPELRALFVEAPGEISLNGFAALKSLDSNADNLFDSADAAWNDLRVWVDANHDGRTDAGELKTFADLNIT